jgi:hypothetical protein
MRSAVTPPSHRLLPNRILSHSARAANGQQYGVMGWLGFIHLQFQDPSNLSLHSEMSLQKTQGPAYDLPRACIIILYVKVMLPVWVIHHIKHHVRCQPFSYH